MQDSMVESLEDKVVGTVGDCWVLQILQLDSEYCSAVLRMGDFGH